MLFWSIIGIVALVVAATTLSTIGIYNRLVGLNNLCSNGFAQIEVQLKRRYDLIPNLVESTQAYLQHERSTLEEVIAARNQASQGLATAAATQGKNPEALQAWVGAENQLAGALGKFSFVMKDPDLKANQNVANLTEELTSTENRIAFARQAYNDWVTTFNTYRQGFPALVFAGLFGYGSDLPLLQFENSSQHQEAPQISLVYARLFRSTAAC